MSRRVFTPPLYRAAPGVFRCAALACTLLLTLLAGLAIAQGGHHAPRPSPTPAPAWIVRGHTQGVVAVLAGALVLRGTLSPALPGVNTLRLRIEAGATALRLGAPGVLTLRIVMPGMAMRPLGVTLHAQGRQYRGTIVLPMFGPYVARVVLATPRRQWQGTLRLAVPLVLSR